MPQSFFLKPVLAKLSIQISNKGDSLRNGTLEAIADVWTLILKLNSCVVTTTNIISPPPPPAWTPRHLIHFILKNQIFTLPEGNWRAWPPRMLVGRRPEGRMICPEGVMSVWPPSCTVCCWAALAGMNSASCPSTVTVCIGCTTLYTPPPPAESSWLPCCKQVSCMIQKVWVWFLTNWKLECRNI